MKRTFIIKDIVWMGFAFLVCLGGLRVGFCSFQQPFSGFLPFLAGLLLGLLASSWIPFVDAGNFRLLVIWEEQRSKKYPDIPVAKEIYNMAPWVTPLSLMGPKGIPKPIVQKINDSFRKAMDAPIFWPY